VGTEYDPNGKFALYRIPAAQVLAGTNQTFTWQYFLPASVPIQHDGIAFRWHRAWLGPRESGEGLRGNATHKRPLRSGPADGVRRYFQVTASKAPQPNKIHAA
jgi:hypothetical protein